VLIVNGVEVGLTWSDTSQLAPMATSRYGVMVGRKDLRSCPEAQSWGRSFQVTGCCFSARLRRSMSRASSRRSVAPARMLNPTCRPSTTGRVTRSRSASACRPGWGRGLRRSRGPARMRRAQAL
jgi:hypothetical protein